MLAEAAVLCRKNTIQVRELELPSIGDDELLAKNISNSICLSTYKAALLGEDHKHIPNNISECPPITDYELTGIIMEIRNHLKGRFQPGEKLALQPVMRPPSGYSAGYSYEYFGGNVIYCIIPKIATDLGCVLPYRGNYFANTSLNELMPCIIRAYYATYHTKQYVYEHFMGVKEQGELALMGCARPIGIGAIDHAANGPVSSKLIVVADIDEQHPERTRTLVPEGAAKEQGETLIYINTKDIDAVNGLRELNRGTGFDNVFVFAAIPALLKQIDAVSGNDGCLSFFAGPADRQFTVPLSFYDVHYEGTHIVGTPDGSTQDMLECLTLSVENRLDPSYMVAYIGGLQATPETILNLPNILRRKRLIYPHIDLPLTAIKNFRGRQSGNPLFKALADICERNHNVWYEEAEVYLLECYQA